MNDFTEHRLVGSRSADVDAAAEGIAIVDLGRRAFVRHALVGLGAMVAVAATQGFAAEEKKPREIPIFNPMCVAFSPDGKRLAVGLSRLGNRNGVLIYDTGTLREVGWCKREKESVSVVAFTADGKTLLTGGYDKTVRLWDTDTYREQGILEGHTGNVRTFAASSKGDLLATASDDDTVRIWNTRTKKCVKTLHSEMRSPKCITFSPDATLLAVVGGERAIVWNTSSFEVRNTLSLDGKRLASVSFSPDGKRTVLAANDKEFRILSTETSTTEAIVTTSFRATSTKYSPDGSWIATAGASVALHRADTGKLHRVLYNTLQRPTGVDVYGMAFSHDGKLLAIAKNGEHDLLVKGETMFDHGVTLWDVREILKPIQ